MYFARLMQVVQSKEKLSADDGNVGFGEGSGFELVMSVSVNERE
jgi:hypothetical protein